MLQTDRMETKVVNGSMIEKQLELPGRILQDCLYDIAFKMPIEHQREFLDTVTKTSLNYFHKLVADIEGEEVRFYGEDPVWDFRKAVVAHLATNLFLSIANMREEIEDSSLIAF